MPSELESVPDPLLLAVSSYFGDEDLIAFELVSKRFRQLDLLSSWEDICHKRWKDWARYRWLNLRKSHPDLVSATWKQRFLWVEKDRSRRSLTHDEFQRIQWYFNFTPDAGGRGWETLRQCCFRGGLLYVPSYPPLKYRLTHNAEDGRQELLVEDFPPHTIDRLAFNGEWIITNENVTIISCHKTEKLIYKDRGFLDREYI